MIYYIIIMIGLATDLLSSQRALANEALAKAESGVKITDLDPQSVRDPEARRCLILEQEERQHYRYSIQPRLDDWNFKAEPWQQVAASIAPAVNKIYLANALPDWVKFSVKQLLADKPMAISYTELKNALTQAIHPAQQAFNKVVCDFNNPKLVYVNSIGRCYNQSVIAGAAYSWPELEQSLGLVNASEGFKPPYFDAKKLELRVTVNRNQQKTVVVNYSLKELVTQTHTSSDQVIEKILNLRKPLNEDQYINRIKMRVGCF